MRTGERGFTLLEVLIGFVILSVSLGAILSVFSSGFQTVTLSERYSRAVMAAESQMARFGHDLPLDPGTQSGDLDGGYTWRASIEEYREADWPPADSDALLVRINLIVSWPSQGGSRDVALTSLRPLPEPEL